VRKAAARAKALEDGEELTFPVLNGDHLRKVRFTFHATGVIV